MNDAPVVADVQATTAEDTALVIALGAYATDVDSKTLTTQIITGPTHGVLTQNADGSYTYTPEANYNGADSFTYQANDGDLNSNIATVSLNVTAVNDAPIAGDLNLAAVEDTALVMNLLAAASDIDDKRTVYAAQGPLPQAGKGTNEKSNPCFSGNWLELGNSMDLEHQAYGMERTVTTHAGIAYDLSMAYAGRLGLSGVYMQI